MIKKTADTKKVFRKKVIKSSNKLIRFIRKKIFLIQAATLQTL